MAVERIFTRDHGRYPRGKRLTLRSNAEWQSWFPDWEKITASPDDLINVPAKRGRPPKED